MHGYPLEVTASRRRAVTPGIARRVHDTRQVVPDWSRAADDLDGVHLTMAGHFDQCQPAIDATEGQGVMLTSWDPDQTCWLADVTRPVPWLRDDDAAWSQREP